MKPINPILITKNDILALDIATHTGYYSEHGSGTWNFTESIKRNGCKQHKDFRDTLMKFIRENDIKQLVAEDVNVNNHFIDMRKLCEFRGVLLEVCDELNLPSTEFINVATLKKWATGNGHATKAQMIDACVNLFHHNPCDDNEADACLLYHYYIHKHRIR